MMVIPTAALPAQTLRTNLGGQDCQITIRQKSTGLFLDLVMDDLPVALGVLCHPGNRLIRAPYTGFVGDLAFYDTEPGAAPLLAGFPPDQVTYPGLGDRYFLAYLP